MSAAIATLAELAALNNTGATTEQQITEGKALFVLDSGSGFSGSFVYRSGILPVGVLGIQSTGVPGGYWEAVGYKNLVEWVVSQNFSVSGHTHQPAHITGLTDWLATKEISASQIVGLTFPDSDVKTVNFISPDANRNIELTSIDIGAASAEDLIALQNNVDNQLLNFQNSVNTQISTSELIITDNVIATLTAEPLTWEDLSGKPNTLTNIIELIALAPPSDKGFLYKNATENISLIQSIEQNLVTGLSSDLNNKQPKTDSLTSIAYVGATPPTTGFLVKQGTGAFAIESEIAWSKINGKPNFIDALNQLAGEGYLYRDTEGVWSLEQPPTAKPVTIPGNLGPIISTPVYTVALEVLPALLEDSYVFITIAADASYGQGMVYFSTDGNDPDPPNKIFSFQLPTGYQQYREIYAAGTSIRAIAPTTAEFVNIQTAPILIK